MPLNAMISFAAPQDDPGGLPVYGPYFLCGWRVTSDLPLPELTPLSSSEHEASRFVEVRLKLAGKWTEGESDTFRYVLEPTGSFLLQLPGLAVFRVSPDGKTVTLHPAADADLQLLRAHFYGSIVAVLCFFHALLPLHGACVRIGDGAAIFTGVSGAGKSTLAAAFSRAGYPLLCDDVCAIDLHSEDAPKVWPAFPRVKLLPDAIQAFALDSETLYTQAAGGRKGHFLVQEGPLDVPVALPVSGIYLLESSAISNIEVTPLHGAAAFLPIKTQIHRGNMGTAMGLRATIFRNLSTVLQRVPVYRLSRPMDLTRIHEVVEAVVQSHSGRPLVKA